ncbi:MAG: hypothetical protein LC620_02365, partial [Halobacteriales archaeon]|nr:hypothetical protein [Halobacteriales archaeon]
MQDLQARRVARAGMPWLLLLSGLAAAAILLVASPASAQSCVSGPPPNDCFATATVVAATPFVTTQSTLEATVEVYEPLPVPVGEVDADTVWFQWTPPIAGPATVSTCGSSYDTVLALYTGATVSTLTMLGVSDDFCATQSQLAFTCVAGTTYRI